MRRALRLFTAVSLALALLSIPMARGPHAAAFEYVRNGGFEEGTAGWGSRKLDVTVADASVIAPLEGAQSAHLQLTASIGSFDQRLYDVPPGTYALSLAIHRSIGSPAVELSAGIAINDDLGQHAGPPIAYAAGADGWEVASATVTIVRFSDVTIAIAGAGSVGDDFYVDAVTFGGPPPITRTPTSTPAPADTATPSVTATGTRTPSSTHTATVTKTPSPTPTVFSIGAVVQNGGFEDGEDGAPAAWRRYGGSLAMATSPVRSGQRAARFESTTDSTKWIYQPVSVSPGSTYAYGAWIHDDDANVRSAYLRLSWYEAEDASGSALDSVDSTSRLDGPAAGYHYLTTGPVTAPPSARSARLRVMLAPASGAPAVIYVDDASFEPAEPVAGTTPAVAVGNSELPSGASIERGVLGDTRQPTGRLAAPGTTSAASVSVVINEVLYDADGGETDAEGEWVELYNASDAPVDLSGWSLSDAAAPETLPAHVMKPRAFVVIVASDSYREAYPGFAGDVIAINGRIGNALGNDGDRLTLRDATGALADEISWGSDVSVLNPAIADVPAGHSIERRAPGLDTGAAADFVDNEHPSPGASIAPFAAKPQPKGHASVPAEVVPAARHLLPGWLGWAVAAAAGGALVLSLSWRVAPVLGHRLHLHR